jgi:hypothetical protein
MHSAVPSSIRALPKPSLERGGYANWANLSIVAVHGLNGHRDKTWTATNNVSWLRDPGMLPAKIPNARIYSWGYDANAHSTKELTAMYLYDHAQKLVSDLSLKRRLTKVARISMFAVTRGTNKDTRQNKDQLSLLPTVSGVSW